MSKPFPQPLFSPPDAVARAAPEGARSILGAAAELFACEGFESVSVSQIAERAGVCKANVFHHFDSKEALFMAVMRAAASEHAAWAEALLAGPGSCADKLRRLAVYEIETMYANEQRTRLIQRESVDHGTCRGRELAQQVFQRNFSLLVSLFRQGQQSGEFHNDFDAAAAAITLRGALNLYFQCGESLRHYEEAVHLTSPAEYAEKVSALVLGGMLAGEKASEKARKKKK